MSERGGDGEVDEDAGVVGAGYGFGAPAHLPGYLALGGELGYSLTDSDLEELARVMNVVGRRIALAEMTGRWLVTRGRREPVRLVPGDVVALSALYALSLVLGADRDELGQQVVFVESTGLARTLVEARSYWLPAVAVEAVLTTEQPDADLLAEIRLPTRSCVVWFAQPVLVPIGAAPDVSGQLAAIRQFEAEAPVGERNVERAAIAAFEALDCVHRRPHECVVEGVLLVADDDGRLVDGAGWLLRLPAADAVTAGRAMLFARRSEAGWRNVLEVLAAIICWGDWSMPEQLVGFDPMSGDRAARRQLRKGRTRDLEEAGGLAGVVILDARRRSRGAVDGAASHASPITHLRRGHFRRMPVGPRDEGRREVRWVNPTVVNPDGAGRDTVRVYRLPPPSR